MHSYKKTKIHWGDPKRIWHIKRIGDWCDSGLDINSRAQLRRKKKNKKQKFLCDCNEKNRKSQSFFLQPVKLYQQTRDGSSSAYLLLSINRPKPDTRRFFSALIEQEGDIWTKISGRRMEEHKSMRQGKVALGNFFFFFCWAMRRVMRFSGFGNFVRDHLWTTRVTTHSSKSEKTKKQKWSLKRETGHHVEKQIQKN